MRTATAALLAATVLALTAGPASAVDADRRLSERVPGTWRLPIADLDPGIHCLRVRTVPVSTGRDLLYVPCQDLVAVPRHKPWGDRPPIVIPVVPRR